MHINIRSDDQEKQSKKKPRLFCDICDCFDLHDTEDCPTQAQMSEDPPHSTHHGSRSEERPYCEICEMFGHWATNCNDDENIYTSGISYCYISGLDLLCYWFSRHKKLREKILMIEIKLKKCVINMAINL